MSYPSVIVLTYIGVRPISGFQWSYTWILYHNISYCFTGQNHFVSKQFWLPLNIFLHRSWRVCEWNQCVHHIVSFALYQSMFMNHWTFCTIDWIITVMLILISFSISVSRVLTATLYELVFHPQQYIYTAASSIPQRNKTIQQSIQKVRKLRR